MSQFIKHFHDLSDEEFAALVENREKTTWKKVAIKYPQPEWCCYPDAVHGPFGCWSLMRMGKTENNIRGIEDCEGCELLKREKK